MAKAAQPTVAAFLKGLPADRRKEVAAVRSAILEHLPPGYDEAVRGTMIVYEVPLALYPDTPNGHPFWFAALAAPRSYLTLHLMPVYGSPKLMTRLRQGFAAAGKRLDIGKACIHYRKADDLALDVIGEIVAALPPERWVELVRAARSRGR